MAHFLNVISADEQSAVPAEFAMAEVSDPPPEFGMVEVSDHLV